MELPELTADDVVSLIRRLYGFTVTAQRRLNSTDDINVHVTVGGTSDNPAVPTTSEYGYVLKILNSVDSKKVEFVDAMHAAIQCSIENGIMTPTPVQNKAGNMYSLETLQTPLPGKIQFLVRLFIYIPGDLFLDKPCTPVTSYRIGQIAARLDKALVSLNHPALSGHKRHWSLTEVANLGEKLHCLDDEEDRNIIRDVVESFARNVAGNYSKLQKGVIHADLNPENLLVAPPADLDPNSDDLNIVGVLDFGDLVHEYHLFNLAITINYLICENTTVSPVEAGGHMLSGYLSSFRLPQFDLSVLKECICGRMAQSLVYAAYSRKLDPSNTYGIEQIPKKWSMLRTIWGLPKAELYSSWNSVMHTYDLDIQIKA